MNGWRTTFWTLWISVFFCSSSYSLAIPFLPLFLYELGVSETAVKPLAGIVFASSFLVGAVMAPVWGSLADKYGKRKMVIRAGLSLGLAYSLYAFVDTAWQLILVRMLHGFVGGFVPASMAIVASASPQERLGRNIGFMQAGVIAGSVMGPLLGGWLADLFGMRLSFLVSAVLITLPTLAVIAIIREQPARKSAKSARIRDDLLTAVRNPQLRIALALLVTLQCSLGVIQPLLTLHIADLQGTLQGAVLTSGFILFLVGASGVAGAAIWGRAGERLGYNKVLIVCVVCAGICLMSQVAVDRLWVFAAVQIGFGLFVAGISPMANSIVVSCTPSDFRGRSFGLTTSANQIGAMLGPLAGGLLAMSFSIPAIFAFAGALLLASGLIVRTLAVHQGERQPLS